MAMLATRTIAWVRNIFVPQGIPPPRLLINFVRGATPGAALPWRGSFVGPATPLCRSGLTMLRIIPGGEQNHDGLPHICGILIKPW